MMICISTLSFTLVITFFSGSEHQLTKTHSDTRLQRMKNQAAHLGARVSRLVIVHVVLSGAQVADVKNP